ncbi:MAG: FkbM family methyltransferase [Gammaproteobacteria bacterium]
MSTQTDNSLYQQNTDLEIISTLIPFLKDKSFIDIGAEKGTFTEFLSKHGLTGVLFEPLPKFAPELTIIATKTGCQFLSYAIDQTDRIANFYVASDHHDNSMDYFSSLHALTQDDRIIHKKSTTVTCRSMDSLLQEGLINKRVGILKIDTEGNDLNVLKGMTAIDAEILMCEYFMPGIYAGWELGHPIGLIAEARRLGFQHCISIKRADEFELVSIDNTAFVDKQWGNLIFLKDDLFEKAKSLLNELSAKKETQLFEKLIGQSQLLRNEIATLHQACEERLSVINQSQSIINELNNEIARLHQPCEEPLPVIVISPPQNKVNVLKHLIVTHYTNLSQRVREFIRPRIGSTDQYLPRRLVIPKHYGKTPTPKTSPTISIVTPSLNQGKFIERTIQSLVDQNYPALEYIIQDGGSVDGTVDVIKQHESSIKFWESKKDSGQSNAINLGFQHANGEIMAYLNSDDILMPGTLNYVADYFAKHPKVDVIYGHRILINESDDEIGRWVLPQHSSEVLTWADYIPQETVFWRKSIWDKVGGKIDESFHFAMDWDLLLRFADAGATFKRLPRFLGAFRVHLLQKTSSHMNEMGSQEMEKLRMRCHQRNVSSSEISKNIRSFLIKHVIMNKLYRLGILKY